MYYGAMSPTSHRTALCHWLESRLDQYLTELGQLCAIECPSHHVFGINQAGAWVKEWARARRWRVGSWPDTESGDSLLIRLPGSNPTGARVLLAAHLDTVYPVGVAG